MNDYPCMDCNFYRWRVMSAWLNRDYKLMREWQNKQAEHNATCDIRNGNWYKGLWQNAQVVDDAARTRAGTTHHPLAGETETS